MVVTNAMRLLKAAGIPFETQEYTVDETDLSGVRIAQELGVDPDRVFKTLVARGTRGGIAVFCIPCAMELNLKKCAAVAGDNSYELVHVKELLGLTGYIRGGCSPLGAKKNYPVYMDESSNNWPEIAISAGQRGMQIIAAPADLQKATRATVVPLIFA